MNFIVGPETFKNALMELFLFKFLSVNNVHTHNLLNTF